MKIARSYLLTLFFVVVFAPRAVLAASDEYDDSQSNPLRIAAYLLHPVGWLAEWTIFRPFHFLVSATEPQEAFFGHRPHPPVLAEPQPMQDYGVVKKVPPKPVAPPPQPQAAAPAPPEAVIVVEVQVETLVSKEVPKIVEVAK